MNKAGWKTTEFWITVGVGVLSAYVVVDKTRPPSQVIAALIVAGVKAAWYVSKRTDIKVSAVEMAAAPAPEGVVSQ
jgi:hypothetical protein